MGATAVFLDGGYLDKVMYYDFGGQRIDLRKLAAEMASPNELLRSYYYHCLPYQSNNPTTEEKNRYSSMHRFVTSINLIPRFQTRLGRLVFRGYNTEQKPIFIQKRVDCMIGVDMALLASKGKITQLALFSGDSDLIPAVEAAKSEGVIATLWHGSYGHDTAPSRELVEICDERMLLDEGLMKKLVRI